MFFHSRAHKANCDLLSRYYHCAAMTSLNLSIRKENATSECINEEGVESCTIFLFAPLGQSRVRGNGGEGGLGLTRKGEREIEKAIDSFESQKEIEGIELPTSYQVKRSVEGLLNGSRDAEGSK